MAKKKNDQARGLGLMLVANGNLAKSFSGRPGKHGKGKGAKNARANMKGQTRIEVRIYL